MNKYVVLVIVGVFGTLFLSVGLRYSQAVLLFGVVAVVLAPVIFHKIENLSSSLGLFMGLADFASAPAKKLFQLDGILAELPMTLAYMVVLFLTGAGWKRDWSVKK